MGLLSTVPDGAESEPVDTDSDDGAVAAPENTPEPPKPVAVPAKPLGRRAQARAEEAALTERFKQLEESSNKRTGELQRELAESRQQLARITGMLEERGRQPQTPAAQGPDPEQLRREAKSALEARDVDAWQAKMQQAFLIEAERKLEEKFKPMQQQQAAPPGIAPEMQMVIMTTPAAQKVLGHGQKGMAMADAKDRELAIMGYPNGPERWRKAFELAEATLGSSQQTASQFPAQTRDVLSALPAGRANGGTNGGTTPKVKLPVGWETWQKASGMDRDEYIRDYATHHPEALIDE